MIDGHTNLAGTPVWEWPYPWIVPLPPLSEEEASFYPWNFEWVIIYFIVKMTFYSIIM